MTTFQSGDRVAVADPGFGHSVGVVLWVNLAGVAKVCFPSPLGDLITPISALELIDESDEVGGSRPGNPTVSVPVAGSPDDHAGGSGTGDHAPAEAASAPAADLPSPVLGPAPAAFALGDRVAVHAPGYRAGAQGTVTGLQPGYRHCFEVSLDSGEGAVFAPDELEHIDVN